MQRFFTSVRHSRINFSISSRFGSSLVVSEPISKESSLNSLPPSTLSAITAAKQISDEIDVLIFSNSVPSKLPAEVKRILICKDCVPIAENVSTAIKKAQDQNNYSHIFASATKFGANILPRSASSFNVSPITDVIEILSEDTFIRPMYAGNALAKVKSHDSPLKLISVRSTAFDKCPDVEETKEVVELEIESSSLVKFEEFHESKSTRPELTSADVVISGGRGMKSAENFVLLEKLADKLGGAAIGASRAAVDAGYVPNDLQVGQTGKVVAPKLYIAVGISGAIQHLSGMKDSKTIVAINKDPDAPIFQVADYGLVQDLFEAISELTDKI